MSAESTVEVTAFDVPFQLTTAGVTLTTAGLLYQEWRLSIVGFVPGLVGVGVAYSRLPSDRGRF